MTCDRVQAEISTSLDEDRELSREVARHLRICSECDEFRTDAIEIATGYAAGVRAGIERLRGAEPATPPRSQPAGALLAAAAALLLACWGAVSVKTAPPTPRALASIPGPAPEVSRPGLPVPDLDELGLLVEREPIPVRLDQELLPARIEVSEIALPRFLRF